MNRACGDCGIEYDDAERNTLCPHPLIMPREDLDRKIAALKLYAKGGGIRFAHQQATGPDYRVQHITWNGFVGLEGMSGEFAPHLFVANKPE